MDKKEKMNRTNSNGFEKDDELAKADELAKGDELLNEINEAFIFAAYECIEYEKRTKLIRLSNGEQLYRSETHMITAIKENEGIHMAALAEKFGVTIGAVSQTMMKLEKKGLIEKKRDPKNQSRFLLALTPEGESAHENHMKFHAEFCGVLDKILHNEPEERLIFLRDFLTAFREKMPPL